jgi:hypothetical protein
MYRLTHRIASSLECPLDILRAMSVWVLSSIFSLPTATMCIALFAALPAPLLSLWSVVSPDDAGRAATPHSNDSLLEPLRIVPHSDHQLGAALRADTLLLEQERRHLLEDGPDGYIELAHLIVEVLIATGERLEGDVRGRAQGRASRTRPTLMQRDLGTRRAAVIAHYWSHTVSGAETIRERICSIAALRAFSADALALVRTHRLSTMPSLPFTVAYRVLLLAPLCAIAASSLSLLRLTKRSGVLQLDDLHVLAREVLKVAPAP